jgi:hypothetical protein
MPFSYNDETPKDMYFIFSLFYMLYVADKNDLFLI